MFISNEKVVIFSFLIFFLLLPFVVAASIIGEITGDIAHHRLPRSLRMERSWTRSGYGLVLVYSNSFYAQEIDKLKMGTAEIRKHSCIPINLFSQSQYWSEGFKKYSNYVFIERNQGVGCGQAVVGMYGGYQLLTLSPDPQCLTVATIMHEIMHTLGIEHEQSRPDRNQYIQIHNGNIQTGLRNVFDIAYGSTAYGPYDFDSVMHYGKFSFSGSPYLPTLSSKVRGYRVPDSGNLHLSYWDKRKINIMTGCKIDA